MALLLDNPNWQRLADEHRRWLSIFNPQYLLNWEKQLSADPEAALCEASVRRRLERWGVTVEPNESLTGKCGGPDFHCSSSKRHFYVEVTCVSMETAERRFGIKRGSRDLNLVNVWGMVEAVFNECKNKAPQCADLDGPAVVAVGTFHSQAAMSGLKKVLVEGLLTGKTTLAWDIDTQSGNQVGDSYEATKLQASAFLKLDPTQEPRFARSSISGVLICQIGSLPGRYLGVLHPNPVRFFDPSCLPGVEFGSIEIDRGTGRLGVSWTGGGDV